MYNLVIADDEQLIRHSLANIIDWNQIGFNITGVFSDGSEVIEFIKRSNVDVLLMDIMMIEVSGLDVAQYISNNDIDAEIVLLTGHKNFEYAQEAMKYGVYRYITKPFSIVNLKNELMSLKSMLDKKRSETKLHLQQKIELHKSLRALQKQFFYDLTIGNVKLEYVESRMNEAQITLAHDNQCLLYVTFFHNTFLQLDDSANQFDLQELEEQVIYLFNMYDSRLEYYSSSFSSSNFQGYFIEKIPTNNTYELMNEGSFLAPLKSFIETTLEMKISEVKSACIPSITDLINFGNVNFFFNTDHTSKIDQPSSKILDQIRDAKTNIIEMIQNSFTNEAIDEYERFIDLCMLLGTVAARSQTLHLILSGIEKLSTLAPQSYQDLLTKISFTQLPYLSGKKAFMQWGQECVMLLISILDNHQDKDHQQDYLEIVKQYVRNHYSESIHLDTVARIVNLNPIYVSRIFKEKSGITFTEYLAQTRVSAAVDYLNNSNKYVYEISELVGYQDVKYFSRVFRRIIGYSPTEYRNKHYVK